METWRDRLSSEHLSPDSANLHARTSREIVSLFDREQPIIAAALERTAETIAQLGETMANTLASGGRVIYSGAGTSGRLGALDAAEWPPTFGISPDRVIALVAGGDRALRQSAEGAEDDLEAAETDLERIRFGPADLLVALSASGTAPYVSAGLEVARRLSASRSLITSNPDVESGDRELIAIRLHTGAEVLAGSTRLKAATATHQVLQRASNVCAVRSGWVYAGRMVEMRPTNAKLRVRAERIVAELGGVDPDRASVVLRDCDDDIKVALVAARLSCSPADAARHLDRVHRSLVDVPGFER